MKMIEEDASENNARDKGRKKRAVSELVGAAGIEPA